MAPNQGRRNVERPGCRFMLRTGRLYVGDDDVPLRFCLVVDRLEIVLADGAHGTDPIFGQILERRARLNSAVGIANFGIIDVAADDANVLFHFTPRLDCSAGLFVVRSPSASGY